MSLEVLADVSRLAPLPYHDAVVRYLQDQEPEVWQWAGSAQARQAHAQAVRSDLLKHTCRLDRDGHPELHARCDAAARRLGLGIPVTLYQASEGGMNAALFHVPGEAHIVFTGAVLEHLQGAELQALLGHELAHYRLWDLHGGVYHTADRVLGAVLDDARASPSQRQTARRYRLYTEVYADRGGCVACAGLAPAVTALVKVQTGLATVSAASYLKQADEICVPGPQGIQADGISHPEVFVRARALRLWAEGDAAADTWLAHTLEGPLALDTLDLPGQARLTALTRRLLAQWLRRRCLRSAAMLAHARSFFPDLRPDEAAEAPFDAGWVLDSPGVHDYLAWLLMDLATADPELDEVPLAAALEWAAHLGLRDRFEPLALKELGLNKRRFSRIKRQATELLQKAEAQAAAEAPHG